MLSLDQPQIQVSVNTEITLKSDQANWVPSVSTNQPTTFSIVGSGGSIVSEWINQKDTAILTIAGTVAGQILTITDGVNNEAVSVVVQSAATLSSEVSSEGDPTTEVGTPGDNAPPPSDTQPIL